MTLLFERPLCVAVVGGAAARDGGDGGGDGADADDGDATRCGVTLVLHHLVYDAHSLAWLADAWRALGRGEALPPPTDRAVYAALARRRAADARAPYAGPTGLAFGAAPARCVAHGVGARVPARSSPWAAVLRPLLRRAAARFGSGGGPVYFALHADWRAELDGALDATNAVGFLARDVVYRFHAADGRFERTELVDAPGGWDARRLLWVNLVRVPSDEREQMYDWYQQPPLSVHVLMGPSCTIWNAPVSLLPLDVAVPPERKTADVSCFWKPAPRPVVRAGE